MPEERNKEEVKPEEVVYTIKGWARLYEELPEEKGGIFSFTHTIWIYGTKWEADGKEIDKDAKCLGLFPILIEVNQTKKKLTFKDPNLTPTLVPSGTSDCIDGEASAEDVPEVTGNSTEP